MVNLFSELISLAIIKDITQNCRGFALRFQRHFCFCGYVCSLDPAVPTFGVQLYCLLVRNFFYKRNKKSLTKATVETII